MYIALRTPGRTWKEIVYEVRKEREGKRRLVENRGTTSQRISDSRCVYWRMEGLKKIAGPLLSIRKVFSVSTKYQLYVFKAR